MRQFDMIFLFCSLKCLAQWGLICIWHVVNISLYSFKLWNYTSGWCMWSLVQIYCSSLASIVMLLILDTYFLHFSTERNAVISDTRMIFLNNLLWHAITTYSAVLTIILSFFFVFLLFISGIFSKKFITSSRGYCRHCNAIVWLNDMKFIGEHCRPSCKNHLIKPVSTRKVARDLLMSTDLQEVILRFIIWILHLF